MRKSACSALRVSIGYPRAEHSKRSNTNKSHFFFTLIGDNREGASLSRKAGFMNRDLSRLRRQRGGGGGHEIIE